MTLPISERDFQSQVIDLARQTGWRLCHFRPGKTAGGRWATQMSGDIGYPDLTLVRGDRLIFAELKSANGHATPGQVEWLQALDRVEHVTAQLWRPHDLDAIATLLSHRPDPTTTPVGAPV